MRIIDLTATIHEEMVFNHPNHPRAPVIWQYQRHEFSQWQMASRWDPPLTPRLWGLPAEAGEYGRGHGVQSEHLLIGTHMGTHIDSPLHLDPTSDEDAGSIELGRCFGEAVLLDVRACAAELGVVTIDAIEKAERLSGETIGKGAIVILNTGHSEKFKNADSSDRERWASEHIGIEHEAAGWFLDRQVRMVGIDSPNIDCDPVLTAHINFSLRRWVGEETILIVENLVNLERIEAHRFWFMALPLPIAGASGSPVRAIAIVADSDERGSTARSQGDVRAVWERTE